MLLPRPFFGPNRSRRINSKPAARRTPTAGTTGEGGRAATIGEVARAVAAVVTEALTGAQEEAVARAAAPAATNVPSAAQEEKAARKAIETVSATDVKGPAGRAGTTTFRDAATEGIGTPRTEALAELTAPSSWENAARALPTPRSLSGVTKGKWSLLWLT